MIVLPWLHLEHGTPKRLKILKRFRHGIVRSRYPLLPRHRRNAPGPYESKHARPDRISPRIMRRRSHTPSHVRPHADLGSTQGKKRALAPRRPARTIPLLVWVLRLPKHVVRGLKREHGRGHVGLDERDRARMA